MPQPLTHEVFHVDKISVYVIDQVEDRSTLACGSAECMLAPFGHRLVWPVK